MERLGVISLELEGGNLLSVVLVTLSQIQSRNNLPGIIRSVVSAASQCLVIPLTSSNHVDILLSRILTRRRIR